MYLESPPMAAAEVESRQSLFLLLLLSHTLHATFAVADWGV